MSNRLQLSALIALLAVFLLGACTIAPPAETEREEIITVDSPVPPENEGIEVPDIEEGKFNVAFLYVGPIGDGGWTYAHNTGRLYIEDNVEDIHTVYLESVPEGADGERAIRNLARKGFDAIFTTSFGYMDATELVAEEFPDQYFVHVSGFKHNDSNFASLFGAMENAKYLAGMAAGARAAEDGSYRVGYIGPFPIPEIVRLGNAMALGVRRTCPTCEVDLRWIFSWFDPAGEAEAAQSLIDAGATVIVSGADTTIPLQTAAENGAYGVPGNSSNGCEAAPDACLGVPYWNWGPVYASLIADMRAGTFEAKDYYLESVDEIVGFYGFMENELPQSAIPSSVIPEIDDVVSKMNSGEFDRFSIFTGPLNDNQGNEVVPAGVTLTQSDLEGIDSELGALLDRPGCTICMGWLVEGFIEDAAVPQ
jgi:basic membrane protein A